MEAEQVNVSFGPGASKIFRSQARFIVAVSGQRGGKTSAGSHWYKSETSKLRQEKTARGIKTVGTTGIICAPTYDTLNTATLARYFEEYPQDQHYYKQYRKEIKVPVAKIGKETIYSTTYTLSVDEPDNLRGKKCWTIWGDEVDVAPAGTWDAMTGRISDHDDGKLLITSTLSRNSWINRLVYQPMLAGRLTNTEIISWPSIERPGFPLEEWNRLKKEMDPVVFARDYEGKFVFESGLVYGDVLRYGVVDEIPEGVKMIGTFFGLDYGVGHKTAIILVGYGSDKNWYVLNEHVRENMSVDEINQAFQSDLDLFRTEYGEPWGTYYDYAGGIAAQSILPGVFPIAANKDLMGRITLIRNLIYQHRLFVLSHCHATLKEMSLYQFSESRPEPIDRDNDALDAMGYAIFNGWPSVDGLEPEKAPRIKNRVEMDLEARGLLKDGVFQNIFEASDDSYFLM